MCGARKVGKKDLIGTFMSQGDEKRTTSTLSTMGKHVGRAAVPPSRGGCAATCLSCRNGHAVQEPAAGGEDRQTAVMVRVCG